MKRADALRPARFIPLLALLLTPSPGLPSGDGADFSGSWETTYGRLVLVQEGSSVHGWYSIGGGISTLDGAIEPGSGRLVFTYEEPGATGRGWFDLSDDGCSFHGSWTEEGASGWQGWEGYRLSSGEASGSRWLIVLEAEWQESMEERDFSFGEMLEAWFERVPGVSFRHRFVHDGEDLARFCLEASVLPGQLYLLLASHGSPEGLELPGGPVGAIELARALEPLGARLELLHFSSCEVMAGDVAPLILSEADWEWPEGFVISGYDRAVDWHLSALIEMLYLDLVLELGHSPSDAADAVLSSLSFAGARCSDARFEASGFSFLEPGRPAGSDGKSGDPGLRLRMPAWR